MAAGQVTPATPAAVSKETPEIGCSRPRSTVTAAYDAPVQPTVPRWVQK